MTTWAKVKLGFAVCGILGSAVVIGGKWTHNRWVAGSIGFEREVAYTTQAPDATELARFRTADPAGLKPTVKEAQANRKREDERRAWAMAHPAEDQTRQAERTRRDAVRIAAMKRQWTAHGNHVGRTTHGDGGQRLFRVDNVPQVGQP